MYMEIQDKNNCIENAGVKEGFKGVSLPLGWRKRSSLCCV